MQLLVGNARKFSRHPDSQRFADYRIFVDCQPALDLQIPAGVVDRLEMTDDFPGLFGMTSISTREKPASGEIQPVSPSSCCGTGVSGADEAELTTLRLQMSRISSIHTVLRPLCFIGHIQRSSTLIIILAGSAPRSSKAAIIGFNVSQSAYASHFRAPSGSSHKKIPIIELQPSQKSALGQNRHFADSRRVREPIQSAGEEIVQLQDIGIAVFQH